MLGIYASDIVGPRMSLGVCKRSVGEPAEGSLLREGLRAPGGLGLQLFTLCVPTFVALADLGGPLRTGFRVSECPSESYLNSVYQCRPSTNYKLSKNFQQRISWFQHR